MPLADEACLVTARAQRSGERHGFARQGQSVCRSRDAEPAPATPRQETRTSWTANWRDVVLREFKALASQLVKIRRWSIAAMKGNVCPTEIIGDDEDDVRFGGISSCDHDTDAEDDEKQGDAYRQSIYSAVREN